MLVLVLALCVCDVAMEKGFARGESTTGPHLQAGALLHKEAHLYTGAHLCTGAFLLSGAHLCTGAFLHKEAHLYTGPTSTLGPISAPGPVIRIISIQLRRAASSCSRRSISMGDFQRASGALGAPARSQPPSAPSTAPASRLVTPSSSMEFEAARRRLLEVEERQRVIRRMESRLEELRQVFVQSERQAAEHGELVGRITASAQQGELLAAENGQRLKKGLRFKKHRPTIVFSSMLGLRTCLPWPVKMK
ncbi:uncharacterized protein LOC133105896 [Conger conger]|uniref:uncharacterized protein LOC133105896 n=1 Tax=Conger conger TaxID=82655 RepID=UPI002A5A212A|nr:uncharacterized protein LOC133105896 [Conger conger]